MAILWPMLQKTVSKYNEKEAKITHRKLSFKKLMTF
jgi:hypothetical protein